jgi:hypothetical protein
MEFQLSFRVLQQFLPDSKAAECDDNTTKALISFPGGRFHQECRRFSAAGAHGVVVKEILP